ncbi:hypothetical protein AMATHDRAFT_51104 [Amanita thiersii Skay4041]|uniref:Uncharacterized protein n=1 Tax=Amanita thiersii Skay4041 TaxID=703135 RepID=A0A2A9NAL3_9AGAR|nr:hypothetical protein AMATHDRAFT_51104 [Amanita thiersii Skay4041]
MIPLARSTPAQKSGAEAKKGNIPNRKKSWVSLLGDEYGTTLSVTTDKNWNDRDSPDTSGYVAEDPSRGNNSTYEMSFDGSVIDIDSRRGRSSTQNGNILSSYGRNSIGVGVTGIIMQKAADMGATGLTTRDAVDMGAPAAIMWDMVMKRTSLTIRGKAVGPHVIPQGVVRRARDAAQSNEQVSQA